MNARRSKARLVWVLVLAATFITSPQTQGPSASAATAFSDDFSSGNLANWTGSTGMVIDTASGRVTPPSARAQPTGGPGYAYKVLSTTLSTVCLSMNVNAVALGSGAPVLLRLRTASNGPIARVFTASGGTLFVKSDASGVQRSSGVALGSGWHSLQLCGTVGTTGSWDLYRDGSKIVSGWVANTGTTPVGRIEIGDNGSKTFTINFDDVVVTDAQILDTDPPTTPGTPTGSSLGVGAISIQWAPSQDASPPITYRIYRDAISSPIASTTATSYTDSGLDAGSTHTYRIDAVDRLNNPPSAESAPSDPITVSSADTDPPTTPGRPTGSSLGVGAISIQWAPSQDASPPITYRIYRDAISSPIASTTATSYTDSGLDAGSTHTYRIDAVDRLNNPPSAKSAPSDPITVSSAATAFSDDFSSGNLANWTGSTGMVIDTASGRVTPPSARAQPTGGPGYAYKVLSTTLSTVCLSMNVNAVALGSGAPVLLRLRTASNGPIARVFTASGGTLFVKSDASGVQRSSGVALGSGWHSLQLCGTVGTTGSWDLYRDGSKIVSGWVANTGTTPVGRIEIGDIGSKTFTINFDDVVVTGPAPPPASGGPNILIFMTDDQRASDTVIPGVMPDLRRWLGTGGREFTNFFGTTPLCCPDRSVILSGRYAHNTGVRTNTDSANLDQSLTMERLLDAGGYETAYVGKFLNGWNINNRPLYFDHRSLVAGGYTNQPWNIDGVSSTTPGYTTDQIGDRAIAYLDQFEAGDDQPWFMMVATAAPHNPWTPAPAYANANVGAWAGNPATAEVDRSDKPPWVQARNYSLAQAEAVRVPQLRTLMSVDDMVDDVMTRTEQLGELSNTLVIYTSDNGYVWGEHRLGGDYLTAGQKRFPYTESVKVPFFVRWDGHVPAGTTDARLTGTVDIVPTVLQAAGLQADYALDGYSLLSTYSRARILLEYWLDPGDASIPTWVSIRSSDYQFVEYYDTFGAVQFREFYDLTSDPWQLVNLLNDGDPNDPDVSGLVAAVRSDALCAGNATMVPTPVDPCP